LADIAIRSARKYPCDKCPLHARQIFRQFTKPELEFISRFKKGELTVDRGATVLSEGTRNPHLYTILQGWSFRYKMLSDGRRQIVNYAMPGDLIGLQGTMLGEMEHSVEALSPMILCVFERNELQTLYEQHPDLAYDITWIASREECMLDENLLSIGRRNAMERLAYLIAFLLRRAEGTGLHSQKTPLEIPITQQHVADTLGLSLVHTNKTVRKLAERQLLQWRDRGCAVLDLEGLEKLAGWTGDQSNKLRPFI
jgi:CRP/FNR family transcriptional regulator, anaerobic regulatory protein